VKTRGVVTGLVLVLCGTALTSELTFTELTAPSGYENATWWSIAALGPNHVWAGGGIIGGPGPVARSTNGGSSWNVTAPGENSTWYSIWPISQQAVWIAGKARNDRPIVPAIMLSMNGGATFSRSLLSGENGDKIDCLAFAGAATAIAVGQRGSGGRDVMALSTNNAGPHGRVRWRQMRLPAHPGEGLYDVHLDSRNTNWMVGGSQTLMRRDRLSGRPGHGAWRTVTLPGLTRGTLYGVEASGDGSHVWVAASDGRVFRSTNGGASWTAATVQSGRALYDMKFQDRLNGWVCGAAGTLYETRDGGVTWTRCNHSFGSKVLRSLAVVPGQKVYVCGTQALGVASSGVPAVVPEPSTPRRGDPGRVMAPRTFLRR